MDFIKNFWAAQHCFITKYEVEPVIHSSDQMTLHQNDSSGQVTLNFKGKPQSTYVKQSHTLPKEQATVITTL